MSALVRRARSAVTVWVAAMLVLANAALAADVRHDLRVVLDPAARVLTAEDRIVVRSKAPFTLALAERFAVDSLMVAGQPAGAPSTSAGTQRWRIAGRAEPTTIVVRWRGPLESLDPTIDHRQTLGRSLPVAGTAGSFLPAGSGWYPSVEGALERYEVLLDLPAGQRGLVAGRLRDESDTAAGYRARFAFDAPSEGIDLIAGPYRIASRTMQSLSGRPLMLRTYFHPEIAELSAGYLDDVARYIELYERWIGPYPFGEFSVVSSPTPTGFGMPTLTYLGIDVLRLPFIRSTSLGHEVLHNWWGNGVYPDYARGNWSEGLTTFMADYAYREREGPDAAREMRLNWLRNLASVPPGQDRPLAAFTARTHGTSQIVGYDKPAMLFLMLRDAIGRDAFDAGVRRFYAEHRFKVASWDDLRRAFESASNRDLHSFFRQWLERAGVPLLQLGDASMERSAEGYLVRVSLQQTGEGAPFALRVPLALRTENGEVVHHVRFDQERGEATLPSASRPRAIVLDPDLRLLRRLGPEEAPPVLRRAMVDPATRTVLVSTTPNAVEPARELAARLQDHAVRLLDPHLSAPATPLLVIGMDEDVDAWLARQKLPARPAQAVDRGTASAWTIARGTDGPVIVVAARDAQSLVALLRPLVHYGRQSFVVFEGGKAIDRGVWPTQPQERRFD